MSRNQLRLVLTLLSWLHEVLRHGLKWEDRCGVGRSVGWLAHAMEQARSGSPYQPRLRYVDPGPAAA